MSHPEENTPQPAFDLSADGERYFLFGIAGLGLCALPIHAVEFVGPPDGPCRSVPGCGGGSSRFRGLLSVRGQVQLCFDLAPACAEQPLAVHSGSGWGQLVPASAERPVVQPVVVAVCGGQTLALRVTAPMRLVEHIEPYGGLECGEVPVPAELVCGCFCVSAEGGGKAPVWLLDAPKMFHFLQKEIAPHG